MSERTMEQTITVDASVAAAYRALTDADEITRWWTTSAESDPRAGGRFRYTWVFPQAPEKDHSQEGAYHDASPNDSISYPWDMRGHETTVTFRVSGNDDGAEVLLVHAGWGSGGVWDEEWETHAQGWGFFLQNLKTYLDQGVDNRAEMLGMKVAALV